ncbi:antibiotic biosynthesis monooxygenase [Kitasatospora sp. GP82]|uniref:antibiotic biosynthesis monooxygenase family protein n=1 Tax=Kitasatospora sp. GP82 TaxID=3035089 RepID=UPI0024760800|nr:antibiotic biosynthesis monooxygenase [Kitasatospora sp. GP82]MDH6125644.1 heme-degrading monooxygenase HmoA [Kitasatospora sp. GP82]
MIVRIWEAKVLPRRNDEFCAMLAAEVFQSLDGADGFEGAELLRSVSEDDHRVLVITRWRDEAAVRAYAGPMWRIRPVWAEGEFGYLEHPPTVWHFAPIAPGG